MLVREAAEARSEKRSADNTSPCGTAVQLPSAQDSDLSRQLSAHRLESFANSLVFRTPALELRARAWAEARSAIRQFHRGKAYRHRRTEATYSMCQGSSKGASLMSKEFALDQRGGNGRAVDCYKPLVAAGACIMNGSCDYFLPCTRFTSKEDGTIHGCHGPQLFNNV